MGALNLLIVPAPDLDGGGDGAQTWWEAPCADSKCLGRGWSLNHYYFHISL